MLYFPFLASSRIYFNNTNEEADEVKNFRTQETGDINTVYNHKSTVVRCDCSTGATKFFRHGDYTDWPLLKFFSFPEIVLRALPFPRRRRATAITVKNNS